MMGKPRVLHVAKILARETDEEHPLTLAQIQGLLSEEGISAERKALYRDLSALDEIGFTIGRAHTRPVSYYLAERPLKPAYMMLLTDAVQTSRSITKANSAAIIRQLKDLVSRHEARSLEARIHVSGRVKTQNESVFPMIDAIQQALAERRDITFEYMRYDSSLHLHDVDAQDGKKRVKTPLFLVYSDDNYYLLAYDERAADHLRSYRVDRMRNIMLLEKSPRGHKPDPDFDIAKYEHEVLGMYSGEPESITLLVAESLVGSIVDIFGVENTTSAPTDAPEDDEDGRAWARMRIKAAPSPVLFGKLAQFAGDVRIVSPTAVREAYRAHLEKCLV